MPDALSEIIRKTKKRKVLDERCDMSVGWDADLSGAPVVVMCRTRQVKYIPEFGFFGQYLCDEHFNLEVERRQSHGR